MKTSAHVVYVEIALQIPHAQSLKEKRHSVKSLKERVRARFNASIAEIDSLEQWQHAVLGVVMISNDTHYLNEQVSGLENLLLEMRDIVIVTIDVEWL